MDLGLKDKKVLILGGSRGIGLYTAKLMVKEGASVGICARGEAHLEDAVNSLNELSGNQKNYGAPADLENGASTRKFVQNAIDHLNGLDILIHNASGFDQDGSEEGWLRSFQVDMMAGVRASEVAIPFLKKSNAASITFIGSMASKYYFGRRSSYGPAKAAMRAYANELAQEFGPEGIRANAISPGAVWFPGGSWDKTRSASPDFYAKVEKRMPLGRLGTGEEIAQIIAFVASPAGIWINAAHIVADGGQVASVD